MKNDLSTYTAKLDEQRVLREVMAPLAVHILARPARHSEKAYQDIAIDAPAAAAMKSQSEQQQDALARAYQDGVVQGRKSLLDEECDQQRQNAYEQGWQVGMDEGYQAGLQLAQQQSAERLQRLEHLLQELPRQQEILLAEAEDDMVALSMDALHRLLGEQAAQVATVRGLVQSLIADAAQNRAISVHLHPDDCQILQEDETFRRWKIVQQQENRLRLVADSEIRLGGVMLRSNAGKLDARLEHQLQVLHASLLQQRARKPEQAGMAMASELPERRVLATRPFHGMAPKDKQ